MSMNEGMATLTHPRDARRSHDPATEAEPSRLSRVLIAFAIAVAVLLVVLFAIGAVGQAAALGSSVEGQVASWVSALR